MQLPSHELTAKPQTAIPAINFGSPLFSDGKYAAFGRERYGAAFGELRILVEKGTIDNDECETVWDRILYLIW